jgi:hypothetical protein
MGEAEAKGVRQGCAFVTHDGLFITKARPRTLQGKAAKRVIWTRDEWDALGSAWPLRRLVAFWNKPPGVKLVRRFTSRQIALERIWGVIAGPEPMRAERAAKPGSAQVPFCEGSKAAQAYAFLLRREGVNLGELEQLTGWQRHTIRGFLSSTARKQGIRMRYFRRARERVYRLH